MNGFFKRFLFSKFPVLLMFFAVLVPFGVSADESNSPVVDVVFAKSGKNVVYTITYGKNTKFNTNEDAPYKFVFSDKAKNELGRIERDFFIKNKEGKAVYTSGFGESFTKITLPVCYYNEKTGLAEKCAMKNFKFEIN